MGMEDSFNTLASALDVTGTGAGSVITSVYDTGPLATGNSGVDWGTGGRQMYVVMLVTEGFTNGGSETATFTVESSAAEALTSSNVHYQTPALGADSTDLPIKTRKVFPLPPGIDPVYLRYLGVRTTRSGTLTAGAISAVLTDNYNAWAPRASAFNFDT